jgi:hypothetical protein
MTIARLVEVLTAEGCTLQESESADALVITRFEHQQLAEPAVLVTTDDEVSRMIRHLEASDAAAVFGGSDDSRVPPGLRSLLSQVTAALASAGASGATVRVTRDAVFVVPASPREALQPEVGAAWEWRAEP